MFHQYGQKTTLSLLFLFSLSMLQATVISPVSILSNSVGEFSPTGAFAAARIIDGSGLPANFDENSLHATGGDFAWSSSSGSTTGTMRFDLGTSFDLKSFVLWNNTGGSGGDTEGVQNFQLSFFDENENLLQTSSVLTATDDISIPQNFLFSTVNDVRLVDFEILSNHGHPSFVGVQEVAFTTAVPEPSSIILCLFSFLFLIKTRSNLRCPN